MMLNTLRICISLADRSTVWQAGLVAGLIVVGAALEAIGIGLIFPFIKLIADPSQIHQMSWLTSIFGPVPLGGEQKFLMLAAAALLAVFVVKNGFLMLVYLTQTRFLVGNEVLLARRLFDLYLRGPYVLHLTRNSADLINNVTGTVNTVFGSVFMGFMTLASESVLIFALVAVLVFVDPVLTVGAAAALIGAVGFFYLLIKHRLVKLGERDVEAKKRILQSLQQGLHSIKEVKVAGREKFILDGFTDHRRDLADTQIARSMLINHAPRHWVETVMVAGMLLVVILILAYGGTSGEILATLTLFAAAAFRLIPSMNRIVMAMSSIRSGAHAVDIVYRDVHVFEPKSAADVAANNRPIAFSDSLTIEDLSFSYENARTPVLNGIDLVVCKGESVGLVGPSGAGKTTLVDVILGLLEPTHGRVAVDGTDIAVNSRAWCDRIGYVPQTINLSDDSLRRNIAFGLIDATIDDDKIRKAISLAQLEDLVRDLPQGLDTPLGERGVRISGGQRQRVGIARALYHDPEVLVFDEATSSLDSETEHEINTAIERLSGEKTVIVIAHRLSTVKKCHRLVLLDKGRIVDIGTFEELTARNRDFCRMVELSTP